MKNLGNRSWRFNDDDREEWINNDEYLYNWIRSTHFGMRAFIRANRAEINEHIKAILNQGPSR